MEPLPGSLTPRVEKDGLRRIWDDLLARTASSNLELELLETYRDRDRTRVSIGGRVVARWIHRGIRSPIEYEYEYEYEYEHEYEYEYDKCR